MICGTLLAAMLGAGFCHFWSVQDIVSNFPTTPAVRSLPAYLRESPTPQDPPAAVLPPDMASAPTPQPGDSQKEFFEGLLAEVRALRNENRNLIDQVGETNRDMMKMQFRLDTHSASFRPLPTSEERDDTSNYRGDIPSGVDEDFPGVLPPRASPVYPLEE
jgi:hypothetical protein